jgi:hypothetical protein
MTLGSGEFLSPLFPLLQRGISKVVCLLLSVMFGYIVARRPAKLVSLTAGRRASETRALEASVSLLAGLGRKQMGSVSPPFHTHLYNSQLPLFSTLVLIALHLFILAYTIVSTSFFLWLERNLAFLYRYFIETTASFPICWPWSSCRAFYVIIQL